MEASGQTDKAQLALPAGLTDPARAYPTCFIDTEGVNLRRPEAVEGVNGTLFKVLCDIHRERIKGQALLKVHVGEAGCTARMRPELSHSSSRFLFHKGADVVVAGDTTVTGDGPRGHRQNGDAGAAAYVQLAHAHGWHENGLAGVPFVVLDRPKTGKAAGYVFGSSETPVPVAGIRRFNEFYPAPGFARADFVVHHAHLKLHPLTGMAGCIRSIAMGCTSLPGKRQLHQALVPVFDQNRCNGCGQCVADCPEKALAAGAGQRIPILDLKKCIGCDVCLSICPSEAVLLTGRENGSRQPLAGLLFRRTADYAIGIMNGFWDKTIHLMHLYGITTFCDGMDNRQTPVVRDIGFLVGKNPFAMDKLAGVLLNKTAAAEQMKLPAHEISATEAIAAYVSRRYGILVDGPLEIIKPL